MKKTNEKFKKMLSAVMALIIIGSIFSMPVLAGTVPNPGVVDGATATGSTQHYSTFVSATTIHQINSTKVVSVVGFYSVMAYPIMGCTANDARYTDPYVTVTPSFGPLPAGVNGCGSIGSHEVYGTSGSWTGTSYSGVYQ